MKAILEALDRRPRGGRFALAPGLAGGRWLVGTGALRPVVEAHELLAPGTVVVIDYDGTARRMEIVESEWLEGAGEAPRWTPSSPSAESRASLDEAAHAEAVRRIHALIEAGDCYQVNLTAQIEAPWPLPPEELFARMCGENPPACAAFVDLGESAVASASPETFLRFDASTRRACSLPIKGTRPRGGTPEEDDRLAAELAASEKDRAEHVMIVDLVRNDLGRVCETGTVKVPRLMEVQRLPAVHHLVSEVEGMLPQGTAPAELFAALFPAGSITGAPKRRVLEAIAALEPGPRGVYCGAIGLVREDGSFALSVAIRTAVVERGVARYGAGGGITIDSDPEEEWQELLVKAKPFLSAVGARAPW